jgi:hypothetical protein
MITFQPLAILKDLELQSMHVKSLRLISIASQQISLTKANITRAQANIERSRFLIKQSMVRCRKIRRARKLAEAKKNETKLRSQRGRRKPSSPPFRFFEQKIGPMS